MRWVSGNSYQPATYLNNRLKGWNSPQGQSIVIIAGSREYRCLAPVYSGARAIINDFADEIRQLGLSNFIYCDDDAIFAHADRRRQPDGEFRAPGLWVHQQTCPRNGARLDGGGISISSPQQEIAMVASVPMTGDHWQPLEAGTLLVLKEGKVVNRSDT